MATARTITPSGNVRVKGNPISKEGVFPYLGSQIGKIAPNPSQIYYVYRSAEELSKQETLDSFKDIPFVDEHAMLGDSALGLTPAEQHGIHGWTSGDVSFDGMYLRTDLVIASQSILQDIQDGKVELSPGYRCEFVADSGSFNGQAYQFRQVNLSGNHIALVAKGRTGPDVRVLDEAVVVYDCALDIEIQQPTEEGHAMTEDEIKAVVMAAMDEKLSPISERLSAMDELFKKKDEEKVEDEGEEKDKPAMDSTIAELTSRLAKLEKQEVLTMDAAIKEVDARNSLYEAAKPIIGVFDHDGMSAQDIAAHVCDAAGIEYDKASAIQAAKVYLQVSAKPAQAMDAAPVQPKKTGSVLAGWGK